jgi:nitrogen fixation protein NifQ
MTGYTDIIRRWATDDRRTGTLPDADGIGEVGLGADEAGKRLAVRFALRLRDDNVETVRFQVFGCGFTIAACAAAAELAEGRPLDRAAAIDAAAVDAVLGGLPAERGYCAELAVEALHAAMASARSEFHGVKTTLHPLGAEDHGTPVSAANPTYRLLMDNPSSSGVAEEDRHLFACLLNIAAREPYDPAEALGLTTAELSALMKAYFPVVDPSMLTGPRVAPAAPPERNNDVLEILLSHVPDSLDEQKKQTGLWLARILAARAAHPGHLWTAMGLFRRPELTAAIQRHLPSLIAANSQNMRWKRFLFRQVCELHGAVLCKAPDCGVCSDYALCFGTEE